MPTSLIAPRYGPIGAALGRALFWCYSLLGKDKYDDLAIEYVHGVPIVVLPTVFNPRVLRTGAFLASRIKPELVASDAEVLDMGTGSGVGAVFAARYARRVVAVDINTAAVRCARINALMNQLEEKIEVRQGDLFAPLREERFDLVLFNPPFIKGTPANERDCAWRSADVAERFAAGLQAHLKPHGFGLVLLSSFGDAASFVREFYRRGFAISVHAEQDFINEKIVILKLNHE